MSSPSFYTNIIKPAWLIGSIGGIPARQYFPVGRVPHSSKKGALLMVKRINESGGECIYIGKE